MRSTSARKSDSLNEATKLSSASSSASTIGGAASGSGAPAGRQELGSSVRSSCRRLSSGQYQQRRRAEQVRPADPDSVEPAWSCSQPLNAPTRQLEDYGCLGGSNPVVARLLVIPACRSVCRSGEFVSRRRHVGSVERLRCCLQVATRYSVGASVGDAEQHRAVDRAQQWLAGDDDRVIALGDHGYAAQSSSRQPAQVPN